MKTALYAGSFDPLTNGHKDVVNKALKVFDKVVLLVAINALKKPIFTLEERVNILKDCYKGNKRIIIDSTDGLTVRKAQKLKVDALIRGLRDVADFEEEQRLYIVNQALAKEVETFYVLASPEKIFLSSHNLILMLKAGEDISPYVPAQVLDALIKIKDRL